MRETQIGGLKTRLTGGTDGKGGGEGPAVILLHGFGAPGDDLVPLAEWIGGGPNVRFLFPEGPLSLGMGFGDSRAWWLIDMVRIEADRVAGRVRDLSGEVPPGLLRAREALERFLTALPGSMPIDFTNSVIGGFSQGAMLTCDFTMRSAQPIAGLVQLSGSLLARQEWRPDVAKRTRLPVFQSHGTHDPILPYVMAERLHDELTREGLAVEWHPFRGGHEIPPTILAELSGFLTKVLSSR